MTAIGAGPQPLISQMDLHTLPTAMKKRLSVTTVSEDAGACVRHLLHSAYSLTIATTGMTILRQMARGADLELAG